MDKSEIKTMKKGGAKF